VGFNLSLTATSKHWRIGTRMRHPPTGKQSYLLLRTSPPVFDHRELQTIIDFSLRSLYGEFNPHRVVVLACREPPSDSSKADKKNNAKKAIPVRREYEALLRTDAASVGPVRAACVFCSPPSHLKGTLYRLDCLRVEDSMHLLGWEDKGMSWFFTMSCSCKMPTLQKLTNASNSQQSTYPFACATMMQRSRKSADRHSLGNSSS